MPRRRSLPDPTRHLKFKTMGDVLLEAARLVNFRDNVFERHSTEIQIYIDNKENYNRDLRFSVVELLLTNDDGDELDYDFHIKRKSILESMDKDMDADLIDIFIASCNYKKLKPLVN